MRGTFQIISERTDSYDGRKGKVTLKILALLDTDEHAFINTIDYVLNEEEAQKHSGKLQGKRIELAITNMEPAFGNRLRARGAILKVAA